MANDNIFQQYLSPPKSMLEYSAEMDQADTRKQSLQTNALTLAAGQQSSQRAEQLRTALLGLPQGATDDQRIQAMRGTATPEGYAAADALDKSLTERRKANAAAMKDEADATKTSLARDVALHDFHAQRLATVQTPEDALAWAREGNTLGIFKQPGQYDRGIAAIQQAAQDPQTFAQWKAAAMQGGQSVAEQLKHQLEQTKQAEQVRQFGVTDQRIQSEGAANRANQIKVQDMIGARQDKADPNALLGPDELTMGAQQYLAGDKGVMLNIGRGAQGAANIVAMRREITRQAAAQGMTGGDIAAKMAEFAGTTAGQRTVGTKTANVEMAADEAQQLIPLARSASDAVVRSGFLPFGKAQIMFDNNSNDPALRQFAAANNALVNVYSRAVSPSGTPTVTDKEHAREMLATAFDQKSYNATLAQMEKEITAARSAPKNVRKAFSDSVTGRDSHPAAPAAPTVPDDISALLKKHGGK